VIAFKDHDDTEYVTKEQDFTTNMGDIISFLSKIQAKAGSDVPEAQTDAMASALKASWADDSVKVAILITDSPPHGTGEDNDNYPKTCKCGNDPVVLAHRMAKKGITLVRFNSRSFHHQLV
jgi:hypothetical protein